MNTEFHFKLYVLGKTVSSARAVANLKAITEKHLAGRCRLDVIDLDDNIELAEELEIFATPVLHRVQPEPVVKIVGDLSETDTVITRLEIDG